MSIRKLIGDRFADDEYEALRFHAGDYNKLSVASKQFDGHLTSVRPYSKSDGIEKAESLISVFHDPEVTRSWWKERLGLSKKPPHYSFEMWFSGGKLRFMVYTPNEDEKDEIQKQIGGAYTNAAIGSSDRCMPEVPSESHIAGGEFSLRESKYAPIRAFSGPDKFETDPYEHITSELVGHQSQAVMFQVVFSPAPKNWTDGHGPRDSSADLVARGLRQGRFVDSYFDPVINDPTEKDTRTAKHISDLEGTQAFQATIRYFVFDKRAETTIRHAKGIENAFTSLYQNGEVNQQLVANRYDGVQAKEKFIDATHRKLDDNNVYLSKQELAALAHFPNDEINTSNVDFVKTVVGSVAPGEAKSKDKDGAVSEKGDDVYDSDFAEVNEHPPVDPESNEPLSTLDKAKQIISSSDDSYYRESVSPDDYPETSITSKMPDEDKGPFLETCAAYEEGNLDLEALREDMPNEHLFENLIRMMGDHIEESYLIQAKEIDEAEAEATGPEESNRSDSAWPSLTAGERSEDGVDGSSAETQPGDEPLPLGDGSEDDLPAVHEEAEQSTSEDRTRVEANNLPTTPGRYAVNFTDTEYRQTRSESGKMLTMNFAQFSNDGSKYMGEDVRKLFVEDHEQNKDDNLWLGYQSSGNNPTREVGLEMSSWFEHISMFGTTGKGKSTLQKVVINQIVRKGYGCVVIDPKGDMAYELMQEIPDNRLDDVIWIEPGSLRHQGKVAAINFLEASVPKDHPRYNREVASIVGDLQAILRAEGYWGAKMAGITKNITRAMVRSENPYTLYDMYNVLGREDKRWNFAKSIAREGLELEESETSILTDIKNYSQTIAEMDEDEVDPVVRRLQDWAENPISKEIVANRRSSISINDAVEEGKILMVRNTVQNEEVKRVISTAIMRRVWVTIQARSDTEEGHIDHDPFFAVIDEFDDVVSEDMNVEKMLSKARSGKMCVCLTCQNPGQIKKNHEDVLDQIFDNTDTMLTFGVRGPKSGRLLAERFGEEMSRSDIQGMPKYRIITRISYTGENGPQRSPALGLRTFPDYPPVRTPQAANQAIDDSLDRYGVEPMSNQPEETDLLISGSGLQEQTVVDFLEQVWGGHLRTGKEVIAIEEIVDEFEEVVDTPLEQFPKGIGVPKELIEVHNVDLEGDEEEDLFAMDEKGFEETDDNSEKIAYATKSRIHIQDGRAEVSITTKGIDVILQQDSGRSQPTETHREVIHGSFRWFSRLGFNLRVPIQRGSESVCDAQAFLPISNEEDKSWKKVQQDLKDFEEEHPIAAAISGTSDLNLEAETTTRRKPARTIENVLRAKRSGKKAVLVVEDGRREGHGRGYHANRIENIMTSPPMYREDRLFPPGIDPNKVDEDNLEPVKILYNRTDKLRIGNADEPQEKFALIPKGKEAVWVDDGTKLKLYDGHGPTANKFGEAKYSETHYGSSNAFNVWARYDSYQREWVVYPGKQQNIRYDTKDDLKEDYQFVRGPLYIEKEIDDLPEPEDWSVMILPDAEATFDDPNEKSDDDSDEGKVWYDLDVQFPPDEVPLIYEEGEMRPLIPDGDDLLTPPREETTNTDSDDDVGESAEQRDIEEIMDSFEQIRLEHETRDLIDGYAKKYTAEEHQRLDEIEDVFGAKNPADIELWMGVWDHWSRDYGTGIVAEYLADATMTSTGLTKKRAKDAVNIAKEFDLLIEATAVDEGDPRIDEDTEILRLVLPAERPDLYVDPRELKQFADRNMWEDLWTTVQDVSEPLKPAYLQTIIEKLTEIEGDSNVDAVVAVGLKSGSIVEEDGQFYLASERPEKMWLTVWEKSEVELESPLPEQEIKLGLSVELLGEGVDHEAYFADALDHNELYSPDDVDDDHYVINDPASDDGPEILEREEPDEPDDPDGGAGETTTEEASTAEVGPNDQQDIGESSSSDPDSESTEDSEDDQTPVSQEAADAATTADAEQPTDGASTSEQDSEADDEAPEASDDRQFEPMEMDLELFAETTDEQDGNKEATDDADSDDEPEVESYYTEVDSSVVADHYAQIEDVYAELPVSGFAPILNADYSGWYITEENEEYDPNLPLEGNETDPATFPKKRSPASAKRDLETIIDNVERTMYATTSYKTDEMMDQWTPARWDSDKGTYVYPVTGNPLPSWEDIAGLMVWGDIDLADELKPQRGDLDTETKATAEAALEAYGEKYAELYGSEDAVFGLDSVGGAYIMGSPAATLQIFSHFHDVKDNVSGAAMVFEEFVERSNERLKKIEAEVNEEVDGAADVIQPDWVNNPNRLYKAPLSIHTKHDAVVTPFDPTDVEYDMTHIGEVDADLVEQSTQWVRDLNDDEHRECVDALVANLWPDQYGKEDGDWKKALETWVTEERIDRQKKLEKEREARENRLERTEDTEVNITPNYLDEHDALEKIDTAQVVKLYACDDWDTGVESSHKTEFNPSWRASSSGSSCFVNTQTNNFGDPGEGGGGYALHAMALGHSKISYTDPSDELKGELRGEAIKALREKGFDVPLFIPDVGSDERNGDGKHDQTPLWAKLELAVELGLCTEDDFERVEHEDKEGGYYKLPSDVHAKLVEIMRDDYGYKVSEKYEEEDRNKGDSSNDQTGAANAGGVPDKVVLNEDSPTDDDGDLDDDDDDTEDELTRFLTYEEPGDVDDDFDVDRDAVRQFVDEFAEVGEEGDKHMKTASSRMMDSFSKWADINNIDLNKLSTDTRENMRKGSMKKTLDSEFDVEKVRGRINGDLTPVYRPIQLSETILDVPNSE